MTNDERLTSRAPVEDGGPHDCGGRIEVRRTPAGIMADLTRVRVDYTCTGCAWADVHYA